MALTTSLELYYNCFYMLVLFFFRKNVPDYSAGRAKNDLGFVMFDLQSDILFIPPFRLELE